jgi:hypothetical protein
MTSKKHTPQPSIDFRQNRHGNFDVVLSNGYDRPRFIGKYEPDTKLFSTRRKPQEHTFNNANAIGFNYSLLAEREIDICKVEYGSETLFTHSQFVLATGTVKRFKGFELQVFLPINEFSDTPGAALQKWDTYKATIEADKRREQAEKAQLSMFETEVQ